MAACWGLAGGQGVLQELLKEAHKVFLIIDKRSILSTMRNTMPKKSPINTDAVNARLQSLGAALRARRKALGVSAVAAAEAAGLSRVTLHRIEKGEPSVTMGAWHSVAAALGTQLLWQTDGPPHVTATPPAGWLPVRIALADYPQLKALAWHVQGAQYLSPIEAHGIYERNARHLDMAAMAANERNLLDALRQVFGDKAAHV